MSIGVVGTPLGFWADLCRLVWLCALPSVPHGSRDVLGSYAQLSSVSLKWLWCSLSQQTSVLITEALNAVRSQVHVLVDPSPDLA